VLLSFRQGTDAIEQGSRNALMCAAITDAGNAYAGRSKDLPTSGIFSPDPLGACSRTALGPFS